jgi:hypothetical protein
MNGISSSNNDTVLFAEKRYEIKIFLLSSIYKITNEVHMKRTMNKHVSLLHNTNFFCRQIVMEGFHVIQERMLRLINDTVIT